MQWCLGSGCDRRCFIKAGVGSVAWATAPAFLHPLAAACAEQAPQPEVEAIVRPPTLFAGIRKPITERTQLEPRIKALEEACGKEVAGPLTHIFRFDTPVEGYDSEIGFPVSSPVSGGDIATHTLREMHFYTRTHDGPIDTLRETSRSLYQYMSTTGLSPELELVEVYHDHQPGRPLGGTVQVMAAFLAWPEVYLAQLTRVLGRETAETIWTGGEVITPHTRVDPRCAWVERSIAKLKQRSDVDQQFDILSRVALVRPQEDIAMYKAMYDQTGDLTTVFRAQEERLEKTPTGGYVDPPRFDGTTLHVSKVPYNKKAYAEATSHREKRKAYCFCNLVREAEDPQVDPIFCYRAAGWARQFWEPILEVEFKGCTITQSILKGDDFCAWDYHLEKRPSA
jgi:effector-binding domain-containing protein